MLSKLMRLLTREPKFNRDFQDVADQIWNWTWHIFKVYTLSYPMVPSQLIAYERIQKYYRLKIFIIRSDFVSFSYYLILNLCIYKAFSMK